MVKYRLAYLTTDSLSIADHYGIEISSQQAIYSADVPIALG